MMHFQFNIKRIICLWLILIAAFFSSAQCRQFKLMNEFLQLSVSNDSTGCYFTLQNNHGLILSTPPLELQFAGNKPSLSYQITAIDSGNVDETWYPLYGTDNHIRNHYKWLNLSFTQTTSIATLNIEFRLFDDAVAYRYKLISPGDSLVLMQEKTTFQLFQAKKCWWSWADYNTLEKLVYETPIGQAKHAAAPFTIETDAEDFLSILEAGIDDYSSMTLKQDSSDSLRYNVNLVPWADGTAVKVKDSLKSPWRVVLVSNSPSALLESKTILNLNDPPQGDFSWVKPLVYNGVWWEMHLGISTWKIKGGRHGASTTNVKKYIDFASEHGLGGALVEGWNTGWENWGQKDAFDFTTPYADFDLPSLTDYAASRSVELIGHHETGGDIIAYESRVDSAFALYNRLGIHYVKTGYAGPVNPPTEHHHGQYMIRHFNKVMRTAAANRLMLDVHEPVIPSGWSRTYPNLMTFEGVRGMEWNAWSDGNPPSHTCMIPFTRGLAGPMDYTPGIFDILEDHFQQKRVHWNGEDKGHNAVHSTLSNQLALLLVNYSPMQMAADLPENYLHHPAFHFIKSLPAKWDESKVLSSMIGQYIVVARRKGTSWYIGAITNEHSRTVALPLDFLNPEKKYEIEACMDNASSHYETDPENYVIHRALLSKELPFELWMAPGGGAMVIIREK